MRLQVGLLVTLVAVAGCDLYVGPTGQDGATEAVTRQTRLAAISQAPYRYRHATYWTLANGCTYSPAPGGPGSTGGWRWFLVNNPLSPERPMVHEGCAYVFEGDGPGI
ncbi:hypothetical protein MHM88_13565 [Epibacterium sp. MM17-32]|uniref:hypothetical protein n=1 Tax=Epibacterium sp. MM17-32 TaxID=2917734 RepID=UPI001EF45351|nr:hypothetical protein [Epibacterium sp. MM17-32]MCG7628832.1 hypothetical protein [Epibacterium sp. MM17-32]